MKFEEQIKNLSSACFEIESQLPSFACFSALTNKQELRRELYKIRCQIGALERCAKLVDAEIEPKIGRNEEVLHNELD